MKSVYRKIPNGSMRGFSMGPGLTCGAFRTKNKNPAEALLKKWRLLISLVGASTEANNCVM